VDASEHMTAEGQRRAGERNLTIHARVCDAHELPFDDGSFDAVTLQFASRHLEIIKTFREIHRVLKPGGIFCHNDMLRPASRAVEVPYMIYLRFSVWFTARLFGSSTESLKCVGYFADAIRHFYRPRELAALLEGIGFENVENRDFLAGVIGIYSAILGFFIPSGGGKWLLEAPYVMQAANDLKVHLGWAVQVYNAAEALPNLINPFWMLPLLGVLGLRARDVVGFTFLQLLLHLPIVLFLLWALAYTLDYHPPVIPS